MAQVSRLSRIKPEFFFQPNCTPSAQVPERKTTTSCYHPPKVLQNPYGYACAARCSLVDTCPHQGSSPLTRHTAHPAPRSRMRSRFVASRRGQRAPVCPAR